MSFPAIRRISCIRFSINTVNTVSVAMDTFSVECLVIIGRCELGGRYDSQSVSQSVSLISIQPDSSSMSDRDGGGDWSGQ